MRIWPAMLLLAVACPGSGSGAGSNAGAGTETGVGAGSGPEPRPVTAGSAPESRTATAGSGADRRTETAASAPESRTEIAGSAPESRTATNAGGAAALEAQAAPASGTASGSGTNAGAGTGSQTGTLCKPVRFAARVTVAEASGSVWVEASFGLPEHVVIVGDSGTHGDFAVIDAAGGAELGSGHLPLDQRASDDLEGLARAGGIYYAITSGGYMRHFRRVGADRFELAVPSYPLTGVSCDSPRKTNCGRDFEGLCLVDPLPESGCAGFAGSRRDGELVCLVRGAGGRLRADPSQVIRVAAGRALSDCNFAPASEGHALYAATNLFGGNRVLRVRGWRQPASARVETVASAGIGFVEAVAAGPGGAIYHFSDTASKTSGMGKFSCPPAGPE